MGAKRFFSGTIVGAIVLYVLGYLLFQVLFAAFYTANSGSATGLEREAPIIWAMFVAVLTYAALLTLMLGTRGKTPSIVGGLVIGAVGGGLLWFTADFAYYSLLNVSNLRLTVVDGCLEAVRSGIAGLVIVAVWSAIAPAKTA